MADLDLQEIHDYLVEIAHRAGVMITGAKPSTTTSGSKKNSADLVTETDQAVEKMISGSLRQRYPTFSFMGEESYEAEVKLGAEPTFVVDPIDGTTNFVHGYPYVSVSLGLAVERRAVVGVVYNPHTATLYSAVKGKGAYVNGSTRLPTGPCEPLMPAGLSRALVCVEWGSDRSGADFEIKQKTFARLCRSRDEGGAMVHGIRSFGSAALNLCAVATGAIDVYWESGCWAWDVCAGWCILEEAGGLMADGNKGNWDVKMDERRYLAVRKGEGQREFVEEFWGFVEADLSYP